MPTRVPLFPFLREVPPVSIHPSAIVSPSAQIGSDVQIGPFCIVEAGRGDRPRLHPGEPRDAQGRNDPGGQQSRVRGRRPRRAAPARPRSRPAGPRRDRRGQHHPRERDHPSGAGARPRHHDRRQLPADGQRPRRPRLPPGQQRDRDQQRHAGGTRPRGRSGVHLRRGGRPPILPRRHAGHGRRTGPPRRKTCRPT